MEFERTGFPVFNDRTRFFSPTLISHAAQALSILIFIPLAYRLFDLSKHEKGPPTVRGQLAAFIAAAIPTSYICYLAYYYHVEPSLTEAFTLSVAYLVAFLHFVQDGRVNVCVPEILIFWSGKIFVHCCWTLAVYLSLGAWASVVPCVVTALSITVLVLELRNNARNPTDTMDDKTIFSLISANFANPVLNAGSVGPIYTEEFTMPPKALNTHICWNEFEYSWSKLPVGNFRISRALVYSIKWKLTGVILLEILELSISLIEPRCLELFLNSLSRYMDGKGEIYVSYYYALLCGTLPMLGACVSNLFKLLDTYSQVSVRVSLLSMIYRKGLNLSPAARGRYNTSKIMNLISTDSDHLFDFMEVIPLLAEFPFSTLFSWYQLYHFLGPTFLAAIVVYAIVVPASGFISNRISSLYEKRMEKFDSRIDQTTNTFRNIKTLKLHAWEAPFVKKILDVRNIEELRVYKTVMYLVSALDESWEVVGPLVSMAVFGAYLYFNQGVLSPDIIFPSLLLLDIATEPFMSLPWIIQTIGQAMTSQKRLNAYLEEECHARENYEHYKIGTVPGSNESAVIVANAVISWDGTQETIALKNISLSAKRGDMICLVGQVGCGKSAFLKALGGELVINSGDILVKGSIAYCSQEVWLQHLSLRENIVFGQKFDEEWYKSVIDACELNTDISILPRGDATDLGAQGTSLSGGQKARIALARAVYSRADVYLLDDVLSAVDEHVGGQLIRKLFSVDGLLAGSTIIMATHSLKVLPYASKIILFQNKQISEQSTFANVCHNGQDTKLYELIDKYGDTKSLRNEELTKLQRHVGNDLKVDVIESTLEPLPWVSLYVKHASDEEEEHDVDDNNDQQGLKGSNLSLYGKYFGYLSPVYFIILVSLVIFSVVLNNFIVIFMGYVANLMISNFHDGGYYIAVYFALIITGSLINMISNLWLYVNTGIKISKHVHDHMLKSIIRAPLSFFEVTPLGRLVNRFSHDIDVLDDDIPYIIMLCLHTFFQLIVSLLTIIIGTPISILLIIPLGFIGNNIRRIFIPTERKVTRIRTASNSPILSQIEDSMNGISTIHIFGRVAQFTETYEQRTDYWIKSAVFLGTLEGWFAIRSEALTRAVSLTVALSVTRLINTGVITVGFAGALTNLAMRSGTMIRDIIKHLSKAEAYAVSLKRIFDYSNVTQEAASSKNTCVTDWPKQGVIDFDSLRVRYDHDGPDVLQGISLSIQSGEKIGIVGRTGSGKSTLSLSLFRILEAAEGKIEIDGVDISTLDLQDLRSRLSIIPQDAQIFKGTIRENLDPLNTVDDARLWEVLDLCHLKDFFASKKETLDSSLDNNLSRGQSQLFCLGRALVHVSSILVMDEATASVDVETDRMVQDTIRKHFKERTIITIAHRLNTIMDSDRVLVLDKGKVMEFGTPKNLIDKKGAFYSMLNV